MACGARADAESVGEEVRREHLQDRSRRDHGALVQDDQAVAEAGGEVEVVQDGEGGDADGTDLVQQFEAGPDA